MWSQGKKSSHGKGQGSAGHRSGHVQTLSLDSMHIPGAPQTQASTLTLGSSSSGRGAFFAAGPFTCFLPFWTLESLEGPCWVERPAIFLTSLVCHLSVSGDLIFGFPESKAEENFQIDTETKVLMHLLLQVGMKGPHEHSVKTHFSQGDVSLPEILSFSLTPSPDKSSLPKTRHGRQPLSICISILQRVI